MPKKIVTGILRAVSQFSLSLADSLDPKPVVPTVPTEDRILQAQQKIGEGLSELIEVLGPALPLTTIEVRPGHTLWDIAFHLHGNGQRWRELFVLNLDQIITLQTVHRAAYHTSPDLIYSGQKLRILDL
jgi:nucleoid-associated protein YgaU